MGGVVTVLLTAFLSGRELPLPLRDGVLGPKRSKKLILTGWPFPFTRGAMVSRTRVTGRFCVMAEAANAESDRKC